MNAVNGFTPGGLPTLISANMPVQSTVAESRRDAPEVYFGELTNADVYVKTRQKEFNYPQGQTNSLDVLRGHRRDRAGRHSAPPDRSRSIAAISRKLPFSDDVTAESRLLMRRNVRDRVAALAPFLDVRSRSATSSSTTTAGCRG